MRETVPVCLVWFGLALWVSNAQSRVFVLSCTICPVCQYERLHLKWQ